MICFAIVVALSVQNCFIRGGFWRAAQRMLSSRAGTCSPELRTGNRCGVLLEHSQDFLLAHDQVLHAVELDLLPGVLAEENEIPRLDVHGDPRAVVLDLAAAHGDDLP